MSRPLRIQYPDAWYHVMNRGRRGEEIFAGKNDFNAFIELLKELVEDLARAKKVQAVQVGGATGRIVPAGQLDTPLSFETVLGAGAITVFDKSRDIVELVYKTLEFLAEESCGKCAPCREGTEAMVEILERFSRGEGAEKDIKVLEELADTMALAAMCGLGQAAPIPVVDSLEHFRGAYDQRISQS